MEKTSKFENLLRNCKSIREIFELQTCLSDNLSDSQVLELRAKYAGFSILEAYQYQNALAFIKKLEAKNTAKSIETDFSVLMYSVCQ